MVGVMGTHDTKRTLRVGCDKCLQARTGCSEQFIRSAWVKIRDVQLGTSEPHLAWLGIFSRTVRLRHPWM